MARQSAHLRSDESAQALVEYAFIIALVALGLIAASVVFRNAIIEVLVGVEEEVQVVGGEAGDKVPNGCKNPVPGERNPNCN